LDFRRRVFFAVYSQEFCSIKEYHFQMSEILNAPQKHKTDEHTEKYFSFKIRGWTNFDPMHKSLARVAENIEQGGGLLTVVEVLKEELRHGFIMMAASIPGSTAACRKVVHRGPRSRPNISLSPTTFTALTQPPILRPVKSLQILINASLKSRHHVSIGAPRFSAGEA
jgi:hypothetical protein